MEKKCSRCGVVKTVVDFPKDSSAKDGFYPACKSCRKVIKRASYLKNKSKILQKQRIKRKAAQDWVNQFKKKCEMCPETHPACLDFHHQDGDKEASIASMIHRSNFNKDKVLREIKKCRVLCSNCHRKFHWQIREDEFNGQEKEV